MKSRKKSNNKLNKKNKKLKINIIHKKIKNKD